MIAQNIVAGGEAALGYATFASLAFSAALGYFIVNYDHQQVVRLTETGWTSVKSSWEWHVRIIRTSFILGLVFCALPNAIGWLIDLSTLRIFDCSLSERLSLCKERVVFCTAIHWLLGFLFMLHVSAFLSEIRSVFRENALGALLPDFSNDLADIGQLLELEENLLIPAHHLHPPPAPLPPRGLAGLSLLQLVERTLLYFCYCMIAVLLCVLLPINYGHFLIFYSHIPRFEYENHVFDVHVSMEMLFFHFVLPFALERLRHRNFAKQLTQLYFERACAFLGLEELLVVEEGNLQRLQTLLRDMGVSLEQREGIVTARFADYVGELQHLRAVHSYIEELLALERQADELCPRMPKAKEDMAVEGTRFSRHLQLVKKKMDCLYLKRRLWLREDFNYVDETRAAIGLLRESSVRTEEGLEALSGFLEKLNAHLQRLRGLHEASGEQCRCLQCEIGQLMKSSAEFVSNEVDEGECSEALPMERMEDLESRILELEAILHCELGDAGVEELEAEHPEEEEEETFLKDDKMHMDPVAVNFSFDASIMRTLPLLIRGILLVLFSGFCLTLFCTVAIHVPLLCGAAFLSFCGLPSNFDMYSIAAGVALLWSVYAGTFYMYSSLRLALSNADLVLFHRSISKMLNTVGKVVLLGSLWLTVIPLLAGLLFELVFLVPALTQWNETPMYPLLQSWAMGLVFLKMWARGVLIGAVGGNEWRTKYFSI